MDAHKPFEIEYRLRRRDGEYRWVKSIGKPTYTHDGVFSGYLGTCMHIHEQRMMHEILEQHVLERTRDLRTSNRELEQSNNELKQFAYVASHDLQEPLRKILTFADRLMTYREQLPDEAKNYIRKINDSTLRMTSLIDDVLNFSAVTNTRREFVKTDLNTIFKDVLKDFDLIIGQKQAIIKVSQLPEMEAIPGLMHQLFHNLVSNSLKFSKPGIAPVITMEAKVLNEADLHAYPNLAANRIYYNLRLTDNGIGFSPEFAEQIFVIFQRLHDKKTFPGTGIGLALCRKIAEYHGGIIMAKSRENEGAEFNIILPVTQ
jgi:two-component system CheB/CheR fusion protein